MAYSEKVIDHYENPRNVGSFGKDEAGGLFDDAIHRRQAQPGALADILGGEERFKNLG